ncbi:DUF6498-containing protein [Halorubrum sp. AD140]|uniref:DUF6498-containing protein n=1 Tax=Halorubrum sp. AD140 TaxID=3050073 RepID=UPI002ACC83C0|nr:DUF6498-containing protein [Halorubrum sp. AD140]MDZ5810638.1 DUF6498-containing protein [Halorubrum sp. AD140]
MPASDRSIPLRSIARGRRPRAVGLLVSNLLPLVGVVVLGWSAAALVTLYWLELGIATLWAVVRALFAGRPSAIEPETLITGPLAAKRVAFPLPRTDLRVHLSTLLVLLVAVPVLALVWLVAGAVTAGVVADGGLASAAASTVALAALGIFVTEAATTVVEYFYEGEYREHSAQTAIRGVFFRAGTVFVGGVVAVTLIGAATVGPDAELSAVAPDAVGLPLLVAVVLVKFAFDLAGLYRDRLVAVDESSSLEIGWAHDPPAIDPIDDPLPDASRRVRPARRGRLVGWIAALPRHPGAVAPGVVCLFVAGLFAVGGAWATVGLLVVGGVATSVLLLALDDWLRYGAVEYRVGEDALVAYDRRFDAALWRVEPWDETVLRVERDPLDERLGTASVVIELEDDERRLPRLTDVDPVLAVFDRAAEPSD